MTFFARFGAPVVSLVLLNMAPAWADLGGKSAQSFVFSIEGQHDTNPIMLPDGQGEEVPMIVATPGYALAWADGVNQFRLDANVRIQRPGSDGQVFEREDPTLVMAWQRATGVNEIQLTASYVEASTRFTELEDSGRIFTDGTRSAKTLGGDWRHSLSDRMGVSLTFNAQDVTFDGGGLVDFRSSLGGIGMTFVVSERANVSLAMTASEFKADEPPADFNPNFLTSSNLRAIGVQGDWEVSDAWSINYNVANVWVDLGESESNWNTDLEFAYQSELFRWSLGAGRSTAPSGLGGFVESDAVRIAMSKELSPLSRLGASGSWRDLNQGNAGTGNQFGTGSLWYERELTERWSFRATWAYREQDGGLGLAADAAEPLITRGQSITFGWTLRPSLSVEGR